jgi:hypothetical protein
MDIAERLRVPYEIIEPTFDSVIQDGLALGTGGKLWLTQAGARHVEAMSNAIVSRIVDKLAQSETVAGPPDRAAVEAAVERIAHRMLLQRDWTDDRRQLVAAR